MGGTFMSLPADYRDYFIRRLHDALSGEATMPLRFSMGVKCIAHNWPGPAYSLPAPGLLS
jgi:histone acetyltransferase (RNA polymerase elongator complex component)